MQQRSSRRRSSKALPAILVTFGLLAVACGSDEAAPAPAPAPAPAAPAPAPADPAPAPAPQVDPAAAGIAHAQAEMAKFLGEPAAFTHPGPPVTADTASLDGGEIWFLPIAFAFVPYFAVQLKGLEDAFAEVGMTVRLCDVAVDPTLADKCVRDAISSGARGIVTGAVTYEFAPNAFDDARADGLSVVFMDGGYPSDNGDTSPWPALTGYASFDGAKATALVADWMIVDSGGAANVIAVRVSDTEWTKNTMTAGAVKEFAEHCPGCTVVVVDSNAVQTPERPSLVAATIAANPDTDYVLPNYDSTVEPSGALEGVVNAGYLDRVKGGTTTAVLSGLQLMADDRFLYANAGQNVTQEAWAGADQTVRLLLGDPAIVDPVIQMRLFTRDNIGELELTQENFLSGAFFGQSGYRDVYRAQWGLG
jgi:ribose transport system substrate-binding protein